MFDFLKNWIYRLFHVKPKQSDGELEAAQIDASHYQDISGLNLTAIFAQSLANQACSDSSVSVIPKAGVDESERIQLLDDTLQRIWKDIKRNVAIGNGCGMIISIPYSVDGPTGRKVYVDTISRDRFIISRRQGDEIVGIAALADKISYDNKIYRRFTDYYIDGGMYIIENKALCDNQEVELGAIPEWESIPPQIRISGVSRLPIGIYKCPASNRRPNSITGVPITYGCNETMQKIRKTMDDIEKEYNDKRVKIFADESLFDKDQELSDVFQTVRGRGRLDSGALIDTFDPAIRSTPYFDKLERLFAQLEKEVGTSRGVLTDMQTGQATATEIRRAMQATFSICDDIHVAMESYIDGLMYGVNVLMNVFDLGNDDEYQIKYDWSYALLEDPSQTFAQMAEGYSYKVIGPEELRQFIIPGESIEESKQYIEALRDDDEKNNFNIYNSKEE